jgi:hypothetical protein
MRSFELVCEMLRNDRCYIPVCLQRVMKCYLQGENTDGATTTAPTVAFAMNTTILTSSACGSLITITVANCIWSVDVCRSEAWTLGKMREGRKCI